MSKQDVIIIYQLPDDQIQQVANYIMRIWSQPQGKNSPLTEEQSELIDLLNNTIQTGRGDFAEHHDMYLYGMLPS